MWCSWGRPGDNFPWRLVREVDGIRRNFADLGNSQQGDKDGGEAKREHITLLAGSGLERMKI